MDEPPSLMVRRFLRGGCDESKQVYDWDTFRPEYYFFYGTLRDPSTLTAVLKPRRDLPQLFPAKIIGYHCMLWGLNPALLDGPQGASVYGMAFEVKSRIDRDRLKSYETDNYKISACRIEFEDGSTVLGRTFKWNADKSLLKEGTFDLKDWKMNQLGM